MDAFNDLDLCLLSWDINEDGPFAAFQFGFSLFFLDFDLIPHKSDVRFDVIFLNQFDVNSWVESLNAEFSICPMLKKVQIRKKKKKKIKKASTTRHMDEKTTYADMVHSFFDREDMVVLERGRL